MKKIAQIPNLIFAQMLANRFNGFVEEKFIDDIQLFVVVTLQ